jgi:tRNA(Ile)-lysidine synthase
VFSVSVWCNLMLAKLKLTLSLNEPLLIGVSGGADSVALLDALVQLGYRPHVAHLNHQWRGAESDADAQFVRELAGRYGLPATIESHRVEPNEDAARQARLAFFESVAARTGIHTLALAHTADDQAETFLLRLIRGAGLDGLAGMATEKQIGSLRIVRPMLTVRRGEVIEYLRSRQLTWREDASNADRRFLRNRIRHELLPLLEREYNPGIRDALVRTAEILRAEAERDPVAAERRAIRQLSFEQVEALRKLAAKEGWKTTEQWPLNLGGETRVAQLGVVLECAGLPALSDARKRQRGGKPPHSTEEHFDADALGEAPFIRTWREGDRFQPLGMTGEKKLQDFFVDEKVPRRSRGRVPLLCATDGRIAWVVGYRIAEPFKVTERTRRVVRIRLRG